MIQKHDPVRSSPGGRTDTHTHTQTNKMTRLCIRETDGQTQHTDGQTNSANTNNITSFIFPSRPWSTPNQNNTITSILLSSRQCKQMGAGPAQIQSGPDGRTDGSDSHAYAYSESLE